MKLNQEEKDELLALMTSSGWDVLVKVLENLKSRPAKRVLSYNLSDGPEGLVIEKARSEGARDVVDGVIKFRNEEVRRG